MLDRYGESIDLENDGTAIDEWLAANPDRAREIEADARALLGLPPLGRPIGRVATLALQQRMRKAARREAAQRMNSDVRDVDGALWS